MKCKWVYLRDNEGHPDHRKDQDPDPLETRDRAEKQKQFGVIISAGILFIN